MARPRKNPTPPAQSGQQVPQDRPTQDAQQGDQTVTGDAPQVPEGQPQPQPQPQELQQEQQDQQAPQKQAPPVQAIGPVPTDQSGADAPAMAAVPVAPPEPEPEPEPEPLDEFLRRVERVHIERDVVATAATHPHASERVWPGTYGGIRLSAGPVSVTYSDGTTE